MATLVCFHAHPDDESSQTSGLLASAAAAGHRAYVLTATDGSEGEVHTELQPGETLADRRAIELADALKIIGAEPPVMLGYRDSGMMGEAANDHPDCFWQADVEEAAARVAEILTDLDADVLTIYDDHGGYGHPDHIQVHRVGRRAAEIAGVEHVYEVTMNRDLIQQMMANNTEAEVDPTHEHIPDHDVDQGADQGVDQGVDSDTARPPERAAAPVDQMPDNIPDEQRPDPEMLATIGTPQADISFVVDVTAYADTKRRALRAHASQMPPDNMFMTMPDEMFAAAFGHEHFNLPDVVDTGGPTPVSTLPGLEDDTDLNAR